MKIDAVYTWVDGSDPVWNKKKIERANQLGITLTTSENIARFADNDELKYSLRSIQKFAPWINKIYIVSDNQVPKWLNLENKKIVIVDHSEIFENKSLLPTFSARSIETNLHRIKGLEEHFIYINDDMFFGNLAHPECFYIDKNKVRVFVSEILPLPKKKLFDIRKRDRDKWNDHQFAIVNSRNLILKKFGKRVYYNIRHGVKPMLRSVLQELEKIFYSDFNLTASKPFRTENDILPIHLFSYYSLIKKIGKPKYLNTVRKQKTFFPEFKITSCNYTFSHVNLDEEQIDQKLNHLINAKPFIFCLNQTPLTTKQHIDIMQSFLKDYFPEKSTFEK